MHDLQHTAQLPTLIRVQHIAVKHAGVPTPVIPLTPSPL